MNNKYRIPTLLAALFFANQTFAQTASPIRCNAVTVDAPSHIVLGKSTVVKLNTPAMRMVVGGMSSTRAGRPVEVPEDKNAPPGQRQMMVQKIPDGIADVDVMLLSPTELFFIGKRAGSMNVVLQGADGNCTVKDLIVTIDPNTLQAKLGELMPEETGIKVRGAENALVLTGVASNAIKLDQIMSVATSYGDGKKVINLMRVASGQQVMLEVKVAEVSKTILDRLGFDLARGVASADGTSVKILSGLFGGNALLGGQVGGADGSGRVWGQLGGNVGGNSITGPVDTAHPPIRIGGQNATTGMIDAQKKDGLVRLLAEPNIMAISGQQASFLSGGKIFIPISRSDTVTGGTTITLEEKEFGIGVKFTPTVLEGTRVNLKMITEVSDLSQTGSAFTTVNNVTSVLPSFTVRRADTTVQLNDGQSFVIAGLIKNNVTESVKRFPGLGDIPILGALFRSSEFQKDQTELLFVITPRLVKPLAEAPRLPTDNHVVPSRSSIYINGSMEGSAPAAAAPAPAPAPAAAVPAPAAAEAQAAAEAPAPQGAPAAAPDQAEAPDVASQLDADGQAPDDARPDDAAPPADAPVAPVSLEDRHAEPIVPAGVGQTADREAPVVTADSEDAAPEPIAPADMEDAAPAAEGPASAAPVHSEDAAPEPVTPGNTEDTALAADAPDSAAPAGSEDAAATLDIPDLMQDSAPAAATPVHAEHAAPSADASVPELNEKEQS